MRSMNSSKGHLVIDMKLILFSVISVFCCSCMFSSPNLQDRTSLQEIEYHNDVKSNLPGWNLEFRRMGSGTLYDIAFPTPDHGWIVSVLGNEVDSSYGSTNSSELYQTLDSGRTWNRRDLKMPDGFYTIDIEFLNEEFGWQLARRDRNKGHMHEFMFKVTVDAGASWKTTYSFEAGDVTELYLSKSGNGWIIGSIPKNAGMSTFGFVKFSDDFGETWETAYEGAASASDTGSTNAFVYEPATDFIEKTPNSGTLSLANGLIVSLSKESGQWKRSVTERTGKAGRNRIIGLEDGSLLLINSIIGSHRILRTSFFHVDSTESIKKLSTLEGYWARDIVELGTSEFAICGAKSESGYEKENEKVLRLQDGGFVRISDDGGLTWEALFEDDGIVQRINASEPNKDPEIETNVGNLSSKSNPLMFRKLFYNKSKHTLFVLGNNGVLLIATKE